MRNHAGVTKFAWMFAPPSGAIACPCGAANIIQLPLDRVLVDDGLAAWQHSGTEAARKVAKEPLPEVEISNVHRTDDSISFDVSRTGVPVIVKESWFPNWEVEGADGPYRATPNQMVVVPTSKHVTLQFGTRTVTPLYTGLSSFVGVYLVGFEVPGDQENGEYELRITVNGIGSALVYIPVQR